MKQSKTFKREKGDLADYKKEYSRIVTAAIGIASILLFIYLGNIAFLLGTLIIFTACTNEFIKLNRAKKTGIAFLVTGFIYIALLLSLNLTYRLPSGKILVLFIFLGTWSFDTAAYYVGSMFGEHKIASKINPNKSLEGLLAGIAAVLIISLFIPTTNTGLTIEPIAKLIWAFALAISAFIGDLIESKFKRALKIKDTSEVLPGHGGFLDRFDSLIMTSFVSFLIFRLFI